MEFAGRLPTKLKGGHPAATNAKNLTWQLNCDLLKYFYLEDFSIEAEDMAMLNSLELRCMAENWRGSFCGEWCDRETFVRGREQMIQYAKLLKEKMENGEAATVSVIEDRKGLSRGQVVLWLKRGKFSLRQEVSIRQRCH